MPEDFSVLGQSVFFKRQLKRICMMQNQADTITVPPVRDDSNVIVKDDGLYFAPAGLTLTFY